MCRQQPETYPGVALVAHRLTIAGGNASVTFDDTGSEWAREGERFTFRLYPNRFLYSRDQNRASAPYLTVRVGPEDLLASIVELATAAANDFPAFRRLYGGEK